MDHALCDFVARLIELRRNHPALRRITWFDGSATALGERDIAWLWRDGTEMTREHWEDGANRCFGFRLGRNSALEAALLVLINAGEAEVGFVLPPAPGETWTVQLDSTRPQQAGVIAAPAQTMVPAHALLLLSSTPVPA